MRLSQSVLSAAGDCLLKAQFTLDRPAGAPTVASASRACGTGFHAAQEQFYWSRSMHQKDSGFPLPTVDDCIGTAIEVFNRSMTTDLYNDLPVDQFLWSDKIPDRATAHRCIEAMVTAYEPYHWPSDWEVLGVEIHGNIADEYVGAECKVGADLVLRDTNGWIVTVDFKTAGRAWPAGKENPRKNTQAPFYNRLIRQMYPGAPGYRFVFDVMILPNAKGECKFERRISDPQPMHEQAVAMRAKTFVHMYEEIHVKQGLDLPANPASTLCNPKFCDAWTVCPFGAALDN